MQGRSDVRCSSQERFKGVIQKSDNLNGKKKGGGQWEERRPGSISMDEWFEQLSQG